MKRSFCNFLPAALLFLNAAGSLYGQNVYFPGAVPFVSLSAALGPRLDLSTLALSKIRAVDRTIKTVEYPAGPTQFYIHSILSYRLTSHWQIGGGFAFQRNDPFRSDWKNDLRLIEQVIYNLTGTRWRFNNRLKIEERWFRYANGSSNSGTRIRFQPAFIRQIKDSKLYWEIYDELYAIPSGPRNSFISENWFYGGIGFTFSSSHRLDTGFGCNSVVMNSRHDLNTLLMLQVMWNYRFSLMRKKEIKPEK